MTYTLHGLCDIHRAGERAWGYSGPEMLKGRGGGKNLGYEVGSVQFDVCSYFKIKKFCNIYLCHYSVICRPNDYSSHVLN